MIDVGRVAAAAARATGVAMAMSRKLRPKERLLPLIYDELRALAARKLAHKKPGQTLQATALVHEA
jgi:ECF sigma factor